MSIALGDIEFIADVSRFQDDLLRLQAAASEPYSRFVYADSAQSAHVAHTLFASGSAEFCPPAAELLLLSGRPVGVLVALDHASLMKRRMASAATLVRDGLATSDPACHARLRLAGTTLLKPRAGDWYLSRIAVDQSARGQGLGRLLINRFLAEGRGRGLLRATLEVDATAAAAQALYARAGFSTIDERGVTDSNTGRVLTYKHMAIDLFAPARLE